jgi:putative ABC transport system ATP-binding protein
MSSLPVIASLHGIHRVYAHGSLPVHALRGIDLDLCSGAMTAIMGPSGCGKSTLLNLLGLIDRPTSGTYQLTGCETQALDHGQRAVMRGAAIGFVFQQFHLLPTLTARENVILPLRHAGVPRRDRLDLATSALERVGLADRSEHRPGQLSGGQQQRVAIARALVRRPPLLLADEPTGALDRTTSTTVMDLLAELTRDGLAVVVVTHDPVVAQRADRCITMSDGQVVEDRQPDLAGGLR